MKIDSTQYIPALLGRIFYLTALILFSLSSNLYAGSKFTGIVTDMNNVPIQDVNIELLPTSHGSVTDQNGYFSFSRIDEGRYFLKFTHISYKTYEVEAISSTVDEVKLNIRLENNNYELDPILVSQTSMFLDKKIIPKLKIERSNSSDLVELLEDLSTITINEIDGINTKVSIRGSESKQVCIMLDGTIINSKMDGSFDINTIPVEIIDHIEIYKGGDISLSSEGMGGLINIVTKKEVKNKEFSMKYSNLGYLSDRDNLSFDRFNNHQTSTLISWPLKIGNIVFSYNKKLNDNKWSYINAAKIDEYRYINHPNIPREQENSYNYTNNVYGMYNSSYQSTKYGIVFNYSKLKYGIPGWYDQPYESAYLEKDDFSYKIFYDQKLSNCMGLKIDMSQNLGSKHIYINEINSLYTVNSKDNYDNKGIKISTSFSCISMSLLTGVEYKKEKIESEMIVGYEQFTENYSAFSKLEWVKSIFSKSYKIHLLGGIREEYFSNTEEFETLYSYGAFAEILKGQFSIIPKISYHRNYRLPTFSSMFWADNLYSAGNPDLKPEFSSMYDTSLSFSYVNSVYTTTAYFTYYYKALEDLIVWGKKLNDKYIPENLSGGEMFGTECGIDLSYDNILKISISLNTLSSKQFTDNVTTNDKEIIYKPDMILSSKVEYTYKNLNLGSRSKYNGHMYLNETNSIDIDPFWLHSFEISYNTKITDNLSIKYYINSDNILDEQYQVIYGYPMPGRKIETGIQLKL